MLARSSFAPPQRNVSGQVDRGLAGGSDGTRTRGLLRDRQTSESLSQQSLDLGARVSSESPQKLHSVFAGESATVEPLCREARRASVAMYMLSS